MEAWKVRGEVLDSDEESEFELGSQPLAERSPNRPELFPRNKSRPSDLIYKENAGPDYIANENAATKPHQTFSFITTDQSPALQSSPDTSRCSSPLSELSDNTPDFSQFEHVGTSASERVAEPLNELDVEHQQILHDLIASEAQRPAFRRNLRQRTTRQLHPFLEERARYLSLCKSRGMRPVRVVDRSSTYDAVDMLEEEYLSAGSNTVNASPQRASEDASPVSSPIRWGVGPGWDDPTEDRPAMHNEDRAQHISGQFRIEHKRRKLDQTRPRPGKLVRPGHVHTAQQDSLPSPSASEDTQSLILSPPRSRAPAKFRMPPGMTPVNLLPTPDVSSEARPQDEFQSTAIFSPSPLSPTIRDLFATESESDTAVSRHFMKNARRPKTVLPASWLRVSANKSRDAASPKKGIARRLASHAQSNSDIVAISSDSDSEGEEATLPSASRSLVQQRIEFGSANRVTSVVDFPDVDNMEHDWVDPLNSANRRSGPSAPRKRQPLIRVAFRSAGHERAQTFSDDRQRAQSSHMKGQTTHKRRTKQTRIPQLSILDGSEQSPRQNRTQPQFVRLAIRQARKAPDHARQSPSSKQIQLHNYADTKDATRMLRQWREGVVAKRSDTMRPSSTQQHLNAGPSSKTSRTLRQPVQQRRQQRLQQPANLTMNDTLAEQASHHVIADAEGASGVQQPASILSTTKRTMRIVRPVTTYRAAQLEMPGKRLVEVDRATAFARRLRDMTATASELPTLTRERLGHARDQPQALASKDIQRRATTGVQHLLDIAPVVARDSVRITVRQRKRAATRLPVGTSDTPRDILSTEDLPEGVVYVDDAISANPTPVLTGLNIFLRPYEIDFGAQPLPTTFSFPTTTLIGSGDFEAALSLDKRDLYNATGHINIQVRDELYSWSSWTEEVKSGFADVSGTVLAIVDASATSSQQLNTDALRDSIDYLLRSVVCYCAHCLYFLDTIDRPDCVSALIKFCLALSDISSTMFGPIILDYCIVLSAQAVKLSNDSHCSSELRYKARSTLLAVCQQAVAHVVSCDLGVLSQSWLSIARGDLSGLFERSVSPLTTIVLVNHTLQTTMSGSFWTVFNSVHTEATVASGDISLHEKVWAAVFTILPGLRIDASGVCMPSEIYRSQTGDWSLLQEQLKVVLERYDATSRVPGSLVNQYLRILLRRSHKLIEYWSWSKCEGWLAVVSDFFAKRGLRPLKGELSHGSPDFLAHLARQPLLAPQEDDSAYHLFLKQLTLALKQMRIHSVYTDKKIGSMVWRFVPSHGRQYRKEAELKQDDLDALRNHFDLLCVLYYAGPAMHRIQLSILEHLVTHEDSHRAACQLSIRAWTHLTSFQVSTNERHGQIDAFAGWYKNMLRVTTMQYRLARTEAEADFTRARAEGNSTLLFSHVEAIVISNQRQISATLVDLFAGLKQAVRCCRMLNETIYLVQNCQFWHYLADLDVSDRHLSSVFIESLNIILECISKQACSSTSAAHIDQDEDSQDFGDASALQEFAMNLDATFENQAETLDTVFGTPMVQLLSNAFGAEQPPDDAVLVRCIERWVDLTAIAVAERRTTWGALIEGYTGSWLQLRDTKQRHLFEPLFLARIFTCAKPHSLDDDLGLAEWLCSLVERESMLKFQHELTSALLNTRGHSVLLSNLPLARSLTSDKYEIRLHDIRQRRLAILSAVLSNMRNEFYTTDLQKTTHIRAIRGRYGDMIKRVQTTMKKNYQDISGDANSARADPQAQGGYVDFVQEVISMLQQYSSDICPIDRFFVDSSAFPLPVDDPTYIVGRLRSYAPKLHGSRAQIELATFMHTTLMRAITDGKQSYFVDQVVAACDDSASRSAPDARAIQHFFLRTFAAGYDAEKQPALTAPLLLAISRLLTKINTDVCHRDTTELHELSATIRQIISSTRRIVYPAGHSKMGSALERFCAVQAVTACRLCATIGQDLLLRLPDPNLRSRLRWLYYSLILTKRDHIEAGSLFSLDDSQLMQYCDDTEVRQETVRIVCDAEARDTDERGAYKYVSEQFDRCRRHDWEYGPRDRWHVRRGAAWICVDTSSFAASDEQLSHALISTIRGIEVLFGSGRNLTARARAYDQAESFELPDVCI